MHSIGGSKGGARDPPRGPNSFIFMQFLVKKCKVIALLGVGAPSKSWIRHCILGHYLHLVLANFLPKNQMTI